MPSEVGVSSWKRLGREHTLAERSAHRYTPRSVGPEPEAVATPGWLSSLADHLSAENGTFDSGAPVLYQVLMALIPIAVVGRHRVSRYDAEYPPFARSPPARLWARGLLTTSS